MARQLTLSEMVGAGVPEEVAKSLLALQKTTAPKTVKYVVALTEDQLKSVTEAFPDLSFERKFNKSAKKAAATAEVPATGKPAK